MQRKERTSRGGGSGDTYVQGPTTKARSSTSISKKRSLIISDKVQRQGLFGTPPPLLGSSSEFEREALLRGLTFGQLSSTRVAQNGDGDGPKNVSSSSALRLPPIQNVERSPSGKIGPLGLPPKPSCSDFFNPSPPVPSESLLGVLAKECRRENRNPNLYRLATPLEISRIPEHLRNLRTIPLEALEGDESEDDRPPSPPAPYYPPRPGWAGKKKGSGTIGGGRKSSAAYWRWEKPFKRIIAKPPPSACRILEEVRRVGKSGNGCQESIRHLQPPPPPPSVVDVEEGQSESEDEDEPQFSFEIVKEPPPAHFRPPEKPIQHCVPNVKPQPDPSYHIRRGPKLLIKAKKNEILLRPRHTKEIGPTKLFIESFDDFATTSKCMETRRISLINEGTTTIRFQWIRAPPGRINQKFLGNASKLLGFGKNVRKRQFPVGLEQRPNHAAHQEPCGGISSGPKKLALHLTTSRKVNPALTRTIKILKQTVFGDPGFQNLLLLLSLRIPRLKRELIRRTQRQRTSRTLSGRVHDLYLQLRRQRRVRYHDPKHSHRKDIQGGPRPHTSGSIGNQDFTHEICTCNVSSESTLSGSNQSDTSDNFYLFTKKHRPECACVRPVSLPRMVTKEEWGPEDMSQGTALQPEDAHDHHCDLCHFHQRPPLYECSCEGISICQPPAEDQGLCICGPCCICSPQPSSWRDIMRGGWGENPGENKSCTCVGPCTCSVEEDNKNYPTTPPPSGRKDSLTTICECEKDLCECDPPMRDCDPPDAGNLMSCDPCECDLLAEDDSCPCGPSCPCVTPPSSPSCSGTDIQICSCQPTCLCDPPPEDFCKCVPFCSCVTPLPSKDCSLAKLEERSSDPRSTEMLAPEDGACRCPTCSCSLPAGKEQGQGFPGDGQEMLGAVAIDNVYHPHSAEFKGEVDGLELGAGDFEHMGPYYFDLPTGYQCEHGEHEGEGSGPPTKFHQVLPQKPPPKIRQTRQIEFLKPPCPEFIFCELPLILLPGQKFKFEVMFRPRKAGIYSQTIHLITHPRLDATAYAIHLHGLCINPQIPHEPCKGTDPEPCIDPSAVNKALYSKMYERQGKQALSAIMDHVLHFHKKQKSTVPFGRLTTEAIFKAHNHNFHYHEGTSERALQIVRTLVQLLVARTNILGNPQICQRNIKKLYYELLKSPKEQDYFPANLNSEQVEELLRELSMCTEQLIQPRVFHGVSAEERCRTGTEAAVHAMTDEVLTAFGTIEETRKNPFQIYIWRKVIKEKLEGVRTGEIDRAVEQRREQRAAAARPQQLDISTQTSSKEALEAEEDATDEKLRAGAAPVRNEDVEHQMEEMIGKSIHESRLHVAHDILHDGIERMLSVLDAMDNIHDYERQQVIFHDAGGGDPGDILDFCC